MTINEAIGAILLITALCAFINHRFIRLPGSIGLMLVALILSVSFFIASRLGVNVELGVNKLLNSIDFNETVLQSMLSFLLFAGALHVNVIGLLKQKWEVVFLATLSVIISTVLVGFGLHFLSDWFSLGFSLIDCMVFGALISPTDPIAVLQVLKNISAPKVIEHKIAGEALFNDGVAIVLFTFLLGIANGHSSTGGQVAALLALQLGGGLIYGLLLGAVAIWLLKQTSEYKVVMLLMLAIVTFGYSFGHAIHVSGPIAVVVAGLMIGHQLYKSKLTKTCVEQIYNFWDMIDELLNAVLFVLIGLEFLVLPLNKMALIASVIAIPLVLAARFLSVGAPISVIKNFRDQCPHVVKILTWGGLRGGVSIALALSLRIGPVKDEVITVTYIVVIFSILVQGLTIGPYIKSLISKRA